MHWIIKVFCSWVQVDHIHCSPRGMTVLDNSAAVSGLCVCGCVCGVGVGNSQNSHSLCSTGNHLSTPCRTHYYLSILHAAMLMLHNNINSSSVSLFDWYGSSISYNLGHMAMFTFTDPIIIQERPFTSPRSSTRTLYLCLLTH